MPVHVVPHVAITLPYHGGIPIGDHHAAVFVMVAHAWLVGAGTPRLCMFQRTARINLDLWEALHSHMRMYNNYLFILVCRIKMSVLTALAPQLCNNQSRIYKIAL